MRDNKENTCLCSLKSPILSNVYARHSGQPYMGLSSLCVYTGVWRYLTDDRLGNLSFVANITK